MLSKEKINGLYRYAIALTNNDELAYDLVHSAIVKARGRVIFKLEAYLKKAIRNLFYDAYKKEMRLVSEDFDSSEGPVNFEDIVLDRDELIYFLQCLDWEERELLFLIYVEAYSYKEVAKFLGVKIGTIMSRLHRCKEKIKTKRRSCGT